MPRKKEANRCVQLTDTGLRRFHEARRKYRKTMEDVIYDDATPSVNTIKRALQQRPVFVDTLEKLWDWLRVCAEAKQESLPDLIRDEDYLFVASETAIDLPDDTVSVPTVVPEQHWGWLSRSVPRPNRLFTGRREALERLHAALKGDSSASLPQAQALTGMGGIGKTQTAIAYLYAHHKSYNGVFWIYAETVEALHDGLASLAEELHLQNPTAVNRQDALQKMYEWFQNHADWLLVLDNADDLITLAPHFPRHHTGRLLLTTRARNTVQWAEAIELARLTPQEGALLLLRRAGTLAAGQTLVDASLPMSRTAMELSDELGGLPLALNQAGAYLAETMLSVPEYLAQYRRYGLDLLDRLSDQEHRSVTVTFRLALAKLEARAPNDLTVDLIRLCAFLAPDAIPEVIFTTSLFPPDGTALPFLEAERYIEVRAAVCGYSLLGRNAHTGTLSMHRLVQKVVQETLTAEQCREWIERTVEVVAGASPHFDTEAWTLCELLLPHWRCCAEYIETYALATPAAAHLLYQAGRYTRARALYNEAERLLCRSLTIAEQVYGAEHRAVADRLDDLACLYREVDRRDEARSLHERALAITEADFGPDHQETADKLHNIALFYTQQQEYAKAEACFLRSLTLCEKNLSPDHPRTATTLTQLAGVYRCQERYEEAEFHYRRALAIYENALEPDHVDIAIGCNNLALLLWSTGHYAEAETLYLRALGINEVKRGKEHPETGAVLWGLALVQWKQNRPEQANASFQQAIQVYQKHYGAGHNRLERLLNYYREFQRETERRRQA